MIEYDATLIKKWNKKIVFAPNGFGKTTTANKINDYLKGNGFNVLLFTRRQLEDLVISYNDKLLVGKTAKKQQTNNDIANFFNNNNKIKDRIIDIYQVNSLISLKRLNSLFIKQYRRHSFQNIDFMLSLKLNLEKNTPRIINKLNIGNALYLDKFLDFDLYTECKDILFKIKNDNWLDPEEIKEEPYTIKELMSLKRVLDSIKVRNKSFCPICGQEYKNHEELLIRATENLTKNEKTTTYKRANLAINLQKSLTNNLNKIDSRLIKIIIGNPDDFSFINVSKSLTNYVHLCKQVISLISEKILLISIDDTTLLKRIDEYCKNLIDIDLEKESFRKSSKIGERILKEFKKIVNLSDKVELTLDKNEMFITATVDGIPASNLYNLFSESEYKRLALAVLKVFIDCNICDALILDDPIDSYDDYYLLIMCKYISESLQSSKLKKWYLLTNTFEALSAFSACLNCRSIIYNENPKYVFSDDEQDAIIIKAKPEDIWYLNNNELDLMKDFFCSSKPNCRFDTKLSFLSFLVTLRNYKDIFLNGNYKLEYMKSFDANSKNVLIKFLKMPEVSTMIGNINNNKNPFDALTDVNINSILNFINSNIDKLKIKNQLNTNISDFVETYYMHYSIKERSTPYSSSSIKTKEFVSLFDQIMNINNPGIIKLRSSNVSICNMRKQAATKNDVFKRGDDLIKLIMKKIVIISYLKYVFEQNMINKLRHDYKFQFKDALKVAKTHKLGAKIRVAIDLAQSTSNTNALIYLKNCQRIHNTYSQIINSFDHALNRMIPPYLSTSFKDLRSLRKEIDTLK